MDNNQQYWIGRYKRVGGKRTVGRGDWTDEEYQKFKDTFSPYLRLLVGQYCPSSVQNVLDFGCGIGRWIELFYEFNYYGADIVEHVIEEDRTNFPNLQFDVIKENIIPFKGVKFDVIWTFVVLQHVVDDELLECYANQFYNRMNKNGVLITIENMTIGKNNTYIKFRKIDEYLSLFQKVGFKLIHKETQIKNHPTIVFKKI